MKETHLEREKALSEGQIQDKASDFSARYFAVYHLQCLAQTHPEIITSKTISTVQGLLKDPGFSRQRRGFFLCRLAAETLAAVILYSDRQPLADQALASLRDVLATTSGHAHRVSAEALGGLPFSICGPRLKEVTTQDVPSVSWSDILDKKGFRLSAPPRFVGRSLMAPLNQADRLLIFKLASCNGFPKCLFREALWTEHLRGANYVFPLRFDIPVAIRIKGAYVFRLKDLPVRLPGKVGLCPHPYAIGFTAHKDYFSYPADAMSQPETNETAFSRVMFRNAWLLGRLTSLGIVHSAPIPLFHNRVQRRRRRDNGRYEWFRGGRLDRWLDSCSYPNLGFTGIRDFEHLISFKGHSRDLYRHIGSHLLSLLLVTGSYFRGKNRNLVGFDDNGKPVDTRSLFDKGALKTIILGIFLGYYRGFVQREYQGNVPLDLDRLASRMIEEMGVDRYMEEILRAADQKAMTDEQFRRFLKDRGYADEAIKGLRKGIKDIVVCTGPHLGAFNERISLPELVEAVETMSALCVAGRYWQAHFTPTLGFTSSPRIIPGRGKEYTDAR